MLHGSVHKTFIQHFIQHDSKMLDEMLGWFTVTYKDKKMSNGCFTYVWCLCQEFFADV